VWWWVHLHSRNLDESVKIGHCIREPIGRDFAAGWPYPDKRGLQRAARAQLFLFQYKLALSVVSVVKWSDSFWGGRWVRGKGW
jgi:hypothetical protein